MGAVCCGQSSVDWDKEVSLFHFKLKDNIGEGAFGKVRIVRHRRTKELYALKYIDKERCIRKRAVKNVLQERRILEDLDHPFIVNLRYAFQDDENCFFVLDLMLGGDLRFHFRVFKHFEEAPVRHWFAELSSALIFLHDKRIVHRDIKPDNVLLDAAGHAHLTDFNIAVHFDEGVPITGVAGSVAYMAPEVFFKRGYTYCVDWWSLGVTLFELAFGARPFKGAPVRRDARERAVRERDPHDEAGERQREQSYIAGLTWANACAAIPPEAAGRLSQPGMDVLAGLLQRDPTQRLACPSPNPRREEAEIRKLAWLQDIDWRRLERKELPPPFVPDPKRSFDPTHAIQENLVTPNQLKARKWSTEHDPSKLSPEARILHEKFTPYDYMRDNPLYSSHALSSGATFLSSYGGAPPLLSRPGTPTMTLPKELQPAVEEIPMVDMGPTAGMRLPRPPPNARTVSFDRVQTGQAM